MAEEGEKQKEKKYGSVIVNEVGRGVYKGREYILSDVGAIHGVDPDSGEIGPHLRSPQKIRDVASILGWSGKANPNIAVSGGVIEPYSRPGRKYKRGVQKFISFKGQVREMDVVTQHVKNENGETAVRKIINVYFDPRGEDNPRQYDLSKGYEVDKQRIRDKAKFVDAHNMRLYYPEETRWGKSEKESLRGAMSLKGGRTGTTDIKTLQALRDMQYMNFLSKIKSGKEMKGKYKTPEEFNKYLDGLYTGTKSTPVGILEKEGLDTIPGAVQQRRSNRYKSVQRRRTVKQTKKNPKSKNKKELVNSGGLVTSKQLLKSISNIAKTNIKRGNKITRKVG